MSMRSLPKLRILVIASALVAIAYDTVWLKDPVGMFWETLLVTVNIVQITREWFGERRVRFTAEEAKFVASRLRGLSRQDAQRLLNMGIWVDGSPGTVLTIEGQTVRHIVYLVSGTVGISCDDISVGTCSAGNFVGEMSVLGGRPASAFAIVVQPARYLGDCRGKTFDVARK